MKNFTRIFLLVLALTIFASSLSFAAKRMVLVEEATNASCPPCAAQNPTFKIWVENHRDNVIAMTYHAWWPGATDPMYLDDKPMHTDRIKYYGIDQQGVPEARLSGFMCPNADGQYYDGAPGDTSALNTKLAALASEESPVTMTVTETRSGNKVTIKVDISTIASLSGKKLRVAAVEYHHYYANAGTNGEKDFEWVTRKMMPDYTGTTLTLASGESKSYQFTYDIKTPTWNADQMYAVAFIQDDNPNSHEVLQAATSLKEAFAEVEPFTNLFTKVHKNNNITQTATVRNPNDFDCTMNLSIDNEFAPLPTGWSATVEPASISLKAGESKDVTVTLNAPADANFVACALKAVPQATGRIGSYGRAYFYSLTQETKYVCFYSANPYFAGIWVNAIKAVPAYANDFVALPLATQIFAAYPATDFDAALFTARALYPINGYLYYIDNTTAGIISSMISAGKDVFIASDMSAGLSDQLSGFADIMSTIGVGVKEKYKVRATFNTQNGQVGLSQFQILGQTGDSVGNGITATCNLNLNNFEWFTDILSITDPKIAKLSFYYDNDKANIGGVRAQVGSSKIVYTTFGLEAIPNVNDRNKMLKNIMDWFTSAGPDKVGPVVTLSTETVDFDTVGVGKSKDFDITIKNTGDQDLVINSVAMDPDFNTDGVFSVVKGNTGMPVTIKPNQGELLVTVRFTPKEKKLYDNNLLAIKSLDKDGSEVEKDVTLNGVGGNASSVYEDNASANGLLSLSAGPNPFVASTKVTVTLGGSKTRNIEMSVIDETGRTVAFLANEAMAPGEMVKEFNAGDLSSGTYFILARTDGTAVRIPVVINK